MNAPQIIVVALLAINVAVNAARDGQEIPKKHQRYNFNRCMFSALLFCFLLWWGGFFGGQP